MAARLDPLLAGSRGQKDSALGASGEAAFHVRHERRSRELDIEMTIALWQRSDIDFWEAGRSLGLQSVRSWGDVRAYMRLWAERNVARGLKAGLGETSGRVRL